MAIDQLLIYNGALQICKAGRLRNLTENRPSRYELDHAWSTDIIKTCLEEGNWQFASRSVKMEYDNTIDMKFGYRYAFKKPDDWVRTIMLCDNEMFEGAMRKYKDQADYIYSDLDTIYLEYVSDDVLLGRNYDLWPQHFFKYVCAELANEVVGRISDAGATEQKVMGIRDKRKSEAIGNDALNRPSREMPPGSWSTARGSAWSSRGRDRR